jgi:hypothetical protein
MGKRKPSQKIPESARVDQPPVAAGTESTADSDAVAAGTQSTQSVVDGAAAAWAAAEVPKSHQE